MNASSPPPRPGHPLSERENGLLARLAAAEHTADPRFVNDLAAGRVHDPQGRAPRWVAGLGLALIAAVLVGLTVGSGSALVPALAVASVVPMALAAWASRQG